jgi:hypothetical protein
MATAQIAVIWTTMMRSARFHWRRLFSDDNLVAALQADADFAPDGQSLGAILSIARNRKRVKTGEKRGDRSLADLRGGHRGDSLAPPTLLASSLRGVREIVDEISISVNEWDSCSAAQLLEEEGGE